MTYIVLIIFISSAIFVTFKLFDRYRIDNFNAITINYLVGSGFGLMISDTHYDLNILFDKTWLPFAVILGILFIITFVLFALSSQKAGVAITAVFSKMSVMIPVVAGIFLYSEKLNMLKIAGIFFTLAAFILILYKKEKSKYSLSILLLPILIFIFNGIIDSTLKYTEYNHISNDYIFFLTTIFITSFIVGIFISVIKYFNKKEALSIRTIIGGTILGLLNFSTTYFMLKAMNLFQSNVLFPVQNVGIVMVSAIFGLVLFREKLSITNWAGIALSILAISLIAFA